MILKPQQTVWAEFSGAPCVVETLLGGGGQGEVYRARLGDAALALKWYFPGAATAEQHAALTGLVKAGPPGDVFLWPVDLAAAPDVPGFGYLMPLREPRFQGGNELVQRRVEPTFRVLATVGLNLAGAFLLLHAKGLAYRDISFGNVFLDPATGEVLVCDTDNIGVDGRAHSGVLGTPRFMAPEIVRGEARPNTQTDQYSLAVLLFYLLMLHHPLEGKKEAQIGCLDLPAMMRLYGTEPVFLADPKDPSNRPVRGLHDNVLAFWALYPAFLKKLFTRAFTRGLHDPGSRVKESEWRQALSQLRDGIVYCGGCGVENFADLDPDNRPVAPASGCWACQAPVTLPPALVLPRGPVMLNHDTQLFPHHLDDRRLYDFSRPVAEVSRHPTHPALWGLKNLGEAPWRSTNPAGQTNDIPPGRSVSLGLNTQIEFGRTDGTVIFPGQHPGERSPGDPA